MKILSWNVNGIRAADKKGLFEWFKKEKPDILCLQEIKAMADQIPPHLKNTPGYHIFFNPAERKGYSGVATFTRGKPLSVKTGFGIEKFDKEGRTLITEFPSFTLFNIYFPKGEYDAKTNKFNGCSVHSCRPAGWYFKCVSSGNYLYGMSQ